MDLRQHKGKLVLGGLIATVLALAVVGRAGDDEVASSKEDADDGPPGRKDRSRQTDRGAEDRRGAAESARSAAELRGLRRLESALSNARRDARERPGDGEAAVDGEAAQIVELEELVESERGGAPREQSNKSRIGDTK